MAPQLETIGHPKHKHPHPKDPKHGPPRGPKEKEIAATLTAATISLAGASLTFATLDAAGDAVAQLYAKMFELVTAAAPPPAQ